jgi:hypothetical protein
VNAQAISAATRTLRAYLTAVMSTERSVTLLPPGEDPPTVGSGVNLYLYQVMESPYLKNAAPPGGPTDGVVEQIPALSLDLSYLLTPFGPTPTADDETDEAHAALGEAMVALHDAPVLTRAHVPGFDADADVPSVLRDAFADLTARLQPVTVEELTRIWSTIGKPFRLSIAYQLSLVQLGGTETSPVAPRAVATRVQVAAVARPTVTALEPAAAPLAELVAGSVRPTTVTITGTGLAAEGTAPVVTVAGAPAFLAGPATPGAIVVSLPPSLRGGPDADVVVTVSGRRSAPTAFRVDPWAVGLSPVRATFAAATDVVLTGSDLATATRLVASRVVGDRPEATVTWSAAADPAHSDAGRVTVSAVTAAASNLAPGTDLANGRYEVRAELASGGLSNPRSLVVAPLVRGFSGGGGSSYQGTQRRLVLRGARLDGRDVRMRLDGAEYSLGERLDAAELVLHLARPLQAGTHTVEVQVDGGRSDTLTLNV